MDTVVSSHPKRVVHVWLPTAFGLIYLAFNVAYTLEGGTDPVGHHWIYPITDWIERPGMSSGFAIGVCASLIILHCVLSGLVRLRDRVWARVYKVEQGEKEQMSERDVKNPTTSTYGTTEIQASVHV